MWTFWVGAVSKSTLHLKQWVIIISSFYQISQNSRQIGLLYIFIEINIVFIYIYINKYQYILRINLLTIETRDGTSYVFCIVRFWNILKCFHLKLIWSSQCKNGNARFSKILITALSDQVWIRNQCLKFRLKSIATAVER